MTEPVAPSKACVLLVDPQPSVQDAYIRLFSRCGYQFLTSDNVHQALEILQTRPARIIIANLATPGMDGIEFLQAAKAYCPKTPAILLAKDGSVEDAVRMVKAGAFDYITAPYTLSSLELALKKAEDHYRLESERVRLSSVLKLQELAHALSANLNLAALAQEAVKQLASNFPVDCVRLFMLDTPEGLNRPLASNHASPARKQTLDLVTKCATTRRMQQTSGDCPDPVQIAIPLEHNQVVKGVLYLGRVAGSPHFEEQELDLLNAFASHIVVALDNALSHTRAVQQIQELEYLEQLSQQLNATLDKQEIIEIGLQALEHHLHPIASIVCLNNEDKRSATLHILDSDPQQPMPLSELLPRVQQYLQVLLAWPYAPRIEIIRHENPSRPALRTNIFERLPIFPSTRPLGGLAFVPLYHMSRSSGMLGSILPSDQKTDNTLRRFLGTLGNAISLALKNARAYQQLHDTNAEMLQALATAIELRDVETEGHSQRVMRYCKLLAERMGWPFEDLTVIERGAILHDIGKIGIPDAILHKPGRLTSEEWKIMKQHPLMGHALLQRTQFIGAAADIVLYHHEQYDGRGYPMGLKGEDIPLSARIFAVVDALDAMTSNRPYRKALTFEAATEEIAHHGGNQFDPTVVAAYLSIPLTTWKDIRGQVERALGERMDHALQLDQTRYLLSAS
ncbi:MAG: HD domain-containing protein [Chloroflexi bacterium]|nr:HD domain-containing protein [Chloroflexota bacterium]